MVPKPPQNKIECWDHYTNVFFNECIESSEISYIKDSQELKNFNHEYFDHYCDFTKQSKIYQAHKLMWQAMLL